ncbi:restriction endonuclease subunit S [Nostoc sp. HG1]|nr:restriction endonuclease subunit S [Nostoc sp. HG1]
MKRYQVYKKEDKLPGIKEIPTHWGVVRNSLLFKEVSETGYGNLELLSILSDKGIVKQSETGRKERAPEDRSSYKRILKGDIGYNLMNAFSGSIGFSNHDGIISPAYAVCRPKIEIDGNYFHYLFRTNLYLTEFDRNAYGIMYERNRLYFENFKKIYVPCPPIDEQKQIARFLDRKLEQIGHFISNKQRLIELLKEQKTAIVNRAVTKGLNPDAPMKPSGIEWLGDIPAHWEIIKLGRLCNVTKLTGFEYTKLWRTDPNGEIIALRGLNIKNNRLLLDDDVETISAELSNQLKRSKLFAGDIVFPCTGTLGHGALIEEDSKYHLNQNIAKITPSENINPNFLLYMLCCSGMQYQINRLNYSGLQPVLLIGTIRNLILQIPPKIEQYHIVNSLNTTTEKINLAIAKTEKEIELIQEYRTTLISDAVTGKIDVRETSAV